jgi:hypothetical protein
MFTETNALRGLSSLQTLGAPSNSRSLRNGWDATNPIPPNPGARGLDFQTWQTTNLDPPDYHRLGSLTNPSGRINTAPTRQQPIAAAKVDLHGPLRSV